jgi:hypothetical protein
MAIEAGGASAPLPSARSVRAAEIVREIAIGGLACLVGGLLIVGLGGRLFMRIAALIDPSSVGSLTSNGNRIGDITVGGTLGFVVFFGLGFGAYGAVLWVAVSQWIPGRGASRALGSGAIAVGLASFFVVRPDERDFRVLEPPGASVAILIAIVAVLGAVIALTDDRLRRRLPTTDPASPWVPGYLALFGLGLLVAPVLVGAYFSHGEAGTFEPPIAVGAALVVVEVTTAIWWAIRVRDGRNRPPTAMVMVARCALLIAVVVGLLRLLTDVSAIVAT